MFTVLLLLLISTAYALPYQGLSAADLVTCPMCHGILDPVCASNGRTYWNLECAKCFNSELIVASKGFCPNLAVELEGWIKCYFFYRFLFCSWFLWSDLVVIPMYVILWMCIVYINDIQRQMSDNFNPKNTWICKLLWFANTRNFKSFDPCYYGLMILWSLGPMVLWFCDLLVLWSYCSHFG